LRQSADEIPVEYQALYILYQSEMERNLDGLITGAIVDARILRLIENDEWQAHLAAAHFNVVPSHALQVLLKQKIEGAILGQDPELLQHLQKSNGFDLVLQVIIEEKAQEWVTTDPTSVVHVAASLSPLCSSMTGQMGPHGTCC
jgi:hypothetical protein